MLELRDLSGERGRRRLYAGLNASVAPGRLLHVQGANGAGKTSLLRMLGGLLNPADGHVLWQGRPISAWGDDYRRLLVYLGHTPALKADLTALENLRAATLFGGGAADAGAAQAALESAGLRGRVHAPARTLSQGQRQRVALSRLMLSPHARLWLLDEPYNALDAAASAWLSGLVDKHLAGGGIVVMTSHQSLPLAGGTIPQTLALS